MIECAWVYEVKYWIKCVLYSMKITLFNYVWFSHYKIVAFLVKRT